MHACPLSVPQSFSLQPTNLIVVLAFFTTSSATRGMAGELTLTWIALHLLLMSLAYRRHVPLKIPADPSHVSRRLIRQLNEDEVRVTHSGRFSQQSQDGGDGRLLAVSWNWIRLLPRGAELAVLLHHWQWLHHLVIP